MYDLGECVDFLLTQEYGTAGLVLDGTRPGPLIRERQNSGERGPVELALGGFRVGDVLAIALLIRVARIHLYEAWINLAKPDGNEIMKRLCAEKTLLMQFYEDERVPFYEEKTPNDVQRDARALVEELLTIKPWALSEFDRAKARLYQATGGPMDLWRIVYNRVWVLDDGAPRSRLSRGCDGAGSDIE
jgi:hypothetical protein